MRGRRDRNQTFPREFVDVPIAWARDRGHVCRVPGQRLDRSHDKEVLLARRQEEGGVQRVAEAEINTNSPVPITGSKIDDRWRPLLIAALGVNDSALRERGTPAVRRSCTRSPGVERFLLLFQVAEKMEREIARLTKVEAGWSQL